MSVYHTPQMTRYLEIICFRIQISVVQFEIKLVVHVQELARRQFKFKLNVYMYIVRTDKQLDGII
jgi:hypothetical protein